MILTCVLTDTTPSLTKNYLKHYENLTFLASIYQCAVGLQYKARDCRLQGAVQWFLGYNDSHYSAYIQKLAHNITLFECLH